MKHTKRIIGGLLLLALLLMSFGALSAQDDYKILTARLGSTDVPTLDPALATDSSSIQILNMTYIGVTALDEDLNTVPGLATDWEVSENEDGTFTYTFNLLQNVPWVQYDAEAGEVVEVTDADGNVRYVTAADMVYGWQRTINPETASEYAYVLYPQVIGGTEAADGAGAVEDIQVSAVDDFTLQVVSNTNYPFQPSIYGLWMARPQPQWAIEESAEFWIEPENFVAYGPYTVMDWVHDESITLVKNPFWPGSEGVPQANIDEIQFYFLDQSVALAQFEAGELDHLDEVPNTEIPRLQSDPALAEQFTITPIASSYYYGFNTRDLPTSNVHLRRALSMAVDRQSLIDNVTQGGQVPAQWFTSPALAAAPTLEAFPDLGITYNPDMAREELALALEELGYASVDELPTLTLLFNTSENHARIAEAIQQMWVDELGIEVQLTNQEFAVYLDQRENFPVWRAGWGQDYPDAHNFLYDVFHSSSNNNDTWWSSEEFDALVEEALTITDNAARAELYAQAEDILVNQDAAILPIYWSTKSNMTAPGVERSFSRETQELYYKWDITP